MSARPKWMPSREGLLAMCHNESLYDNCKHDYAGEEVEESHYRTGLSAQIAVLEELLPCAMRVYGDCEELPLEMVSVDIIEEKIDELRKELRE